MRSGLTSADLTRQALGYLRKARQCLKLAGAPHALERVKLAISSTEGAVRHADLEPYREKRQGAKGPS